MRLEYQHGGDIYSQNIEIDYSANINPMGLPDGVRRELLRCVREDVCSVYPDSRCGRLTNALACHHKVPPDWIVCGNGAADLIFALAVSIETAPPPRGLVLAPTFSEYRQAMETAGFQVDSFKLREEERFLPDVSGLCQVIEQAGRRNSPYTLVFLCNPNNPTGIALKRPQVCRIADSCKKMGTILAVDECFCGFLENEEEYSIIPDLEDYENVFVLKAFTKLYAMAGLRLGYGLCSRESILEDLCRMRQPWSVSGPAQYAGVAALEESGYVERTRQLIAGERSWLAGELKGLGFQVYPSVANYLLFKDSVTEKCTQLNGAQPKGRLYHALLSRGVLIRSCANYEGLDSSYYRICIKTRPRNMEFIRRLTEALARR